MRVLTAQPPSPFAGVLAWWTAIRPKTLTAGAVPVLVGSALAWADGQGKPARALAALIGALLIQIGTNLVNDYYDFVRGADTDERVGPVRATQSGLISAKGVLRGALLSFGLAFVVGLYLVGVGGWPVVVIGLSSLLCGYAYTGGPFPLGYHGLGDVLVLLFFGFIAVGGTYYVQAGYLSPSALWAGLAVGALGTALIVVNNVRDRETDIKAGKRTLAVRLGPVGARAEYFLLLAVAYAVPVTFWWSRPGAWVLLLPLASLPLAWPPMRRMVRESGRSLNSALAETARLQMVFGVLFAVSLWRGL